MICHIITKDSMAANFLRNPVLFSVSSQIQTTLLSVSSQLFLKALIFSSSMIIIIYVDDVEKKKKKDKYSTLSGS